MNKREYIAMVLVCCKVLDSYGGAFPAVISENSILTATPNKSIIKPQINDSLSSPLQS